MSVGQYYEETTANKEFYHHPVFFVITHHPILFFPVFDCLGSFKRHNNRELFYLRDFVVRGAFCRKSVLWLGNAMRWNAGNVLSD
jgi:hypothetical protein